jgi:hypothetical protein
MEEFPPDTWHMSSEFEGARIRILRGGGWQDALRNYKVLVDGAPSGDIKRNSELVIPVSPGLHSVQLSIDWLGSPEVRINVNNGQTRVLNCGPAGKRSPHWVFLECTDAGIEREEAGPMNDDDSTSYGPHGGSFEEGQLSAHEPTWYEVLGLGETATLAEIRTAYRKLQAQYHPDKVAHLGPDLIALAEAKSKAINSAYDDALHVRGMK